MALKNNFNQSYIDKLDVKNIPEEFIQYFQNASAERKEAILESRPDLSFLIMSEEEDRTENGPSIGGIENDGYDGNVEELIKTGRLGKLEAFSVRKDRLFCVSHMKKLTPMRYEFKYDSHKPNGIIVSAKYGVDLFLCKDCNRLFVISENAPIIEKRLAEKGIDSTIYTLEESESYLKSVMRPKELADNDVLYVQDEWIEGKEKCVIHNAELEKICVEKKYKDRIHSFDVYYCFECDRMIIRNSFSADLEYELGRKGIPMIRFEKQVKPIPVKKIVQIKEINPKHIIDDGRIERINKTKGRFKELQKSGILVQLDHDDTIVISDSIFCDVDDHETEEKLIVLDIVDKKNGQCDKYVLKAGFCSDCQKYYVDIVDYKCIYALGHPDVQVGYAIDDEGYMITSGEIFDLESDHLQKLEDRIRNRKKIIHSSKDYKGKYEKNETGYDDGQNNFDKTQSINKYADELSKLESYVNNPYVYRVDAERKGEKVTYYIGPQEVIIEGEKVVETYQNTFWRDVVNTRTLSYKVGRKKYNIKLNRRYEIEKANLFGYLDQLNAADVSFQRGITDQFLVRVLKLRQKQHGLIDIIATIQENQNAIIDEPYGNNIIVQGCAGSGKTMVLLHRISSLSYNSTSFDKSSTLILTPNEKFNLHIKDIADDLQIGYIRRSTIENYYKSLISEYSKGIRVNKAIKPEEYVEQRFVDYVYSDLFKENLKKAFDHEVETQRVLESKVIDMAKELGVIARRPSRTRNSISIQLVKNYLNELEAERDRRQEKYEKENENLKGREARREYLIEHIPISEQKLNQEKEESIARVRKVFNELVNGQIQTIETIHGQMQVVNEKKDSLRSQFIALQRNKRMETLDRELFELEERSKQEERLLREYEDIYRFDVSGYDTIQVLKWYSAIQYHSPLIKNEINLLNRLIESIDKDRKELEDVNQEIARIREKCDEDIKELFSDMQKTMIDQYTKELAMYEVNAIFQRVFKTAVQVIVDGEEKVTIPRGEYRYTLYSKLLFCQLYYGKNIGESKLICIDEGQDITLNEYRLISEMNNNPVMNIYGDTRQLLKPGRGMKTWDDLKGYLHAKSFVLNENYRNTNQITDFCNKSFQMDVRRTGVDGPKVKEISRVDLEEKLSKLKINDERIAVILSRKYDKKEFLIQDILQKPNVKLIGEDMTNGKIALMYVDEVKGIEFDRAYVVTNQMTDNEKYIAFTRALTQLIPVIVSEVDENRYNKA